MAPPRSSGLAPRVRCDPCNCRNRRRCSVGVRRGYALAASSPLCGGWITSAADLGKSGRQGRSREPQRVRRRGLPHSVEVPGGPQWCNADQADRWRPRQPSRFQEPRDAPSRDRFVPQVSRLLEPRIKPRPVSRVRYCKRGLPHVLSHQVSRGRRCLATGTRRLTRCLTTGAADRATVRAGQSARWLLGTASALVHNRVSVDSARSSSNGSPRTNQR